MQGTRSLAHTMCLACLLALLAVKLQGWQMSSIGRFSIAFRHSLFSSACGLRRVDVCVLKSVLVTRWFNRGGLLVAVP
jgi:hypothetical protein